MTLPTGSTPQPQSVTTAFKNKRVAASIRSRSRTELPPNASAGSAPATTRAIPVAATRSPPTACSCLDGQLVELGAVVVQDAAARVFVEVRGVFLQERLAVGPGRV